MKVKAGCAWLRSLLGPDGHMRARSHRCSWTTTTPATIVYAPAREGLLLAAWTRRHDPGAAHRLWRTLGGRSRASCGAKASSSSRRCSAKTSTSSAGSKPTVGSDDIHPARSGREPWLLPHAAHVLSIISMSVYPVLDGRLALPRADPPTWSWAAHADEADYQRHGNVGYRTHAGTAARLSRAGLAARNDRGFGEGKVPVVARQRRARRSAFRIETVQGAVPLPCSSGRTCRRATMRWRHRTLDQPRAWASPSRSDRGELIWLEHADERRYDTVFSNARRR